LAHIEGYILRDESKMVLMTVETRSR